MGMKNHELVPAPLIQAIAKIKRANVFKIIQNLLKHKLIMHKNIK
jgi:RIO kinase 2